MPNKILPSSQVPKLDPKRVKANNITITHPAIAAKWHPTLNGDERPEYYTYSSSQQFYWYCRKCKGSWQAVIRSRHPEDKGCPYCKNRILLKGYNDLQTRFPLIALDWDYEENSPLTPSDILWCSSNKVSWLCSVCGHKWKAMVWPRTKKDYGCPKCVRAYQTSYPEQVIYYYVKTYFPDALNRDKTTIGSELDIYIPSIKTAIEYDSKLHKRVLEKDMAKNKICKDKGIRLIRVLESDLDEYLDCICIKRESTSNSDLVKVLYKIFYLLGVQPDVDLDRDNSKILELYISLRRKNSLATLYPALAEEWNHEKNGTIKPEMMPAHSNHKVWWKCRKCNYEWLATVNARARGTKCPFCNHKKSSDNNPYAYLSFVIEGKNDLASQNPSLASEWHPTKNGDLKPNQVIAHSMKRVWWQCNDCGYEWDATISHRNSKTKPGCPLCANQVVVKGVNDLATLKPELLEEWDYEKNTDIKPEDLYVNSMTKVWWICKKCKSSLFKSPNERNRSKGSCCKTCAIENSRQASSKKIMNVDTGIVYNSLKEASLAIGTSTSNISAAAKGSYERAGGYHWKYL